MSYNLVLVRVPPNSSDEEVERAVEALNEAEKSPPPSASDAEAESRKRRLAEALLEECPELEGGELNYAELARAEDITEEEARRRYRWWSIVGPEEGAGFSITLYDTFVTVDMAAGGTDQDYEDLSRYLRILVREGGFTVWDPQGPNVMDVPTEPVGDAVEKEQPPPKKRRRSRKKPSAEQSALGGAEDGEGADGEDAEGVVEREDVRRGGATGKLINRIISETIAAPLASAGFRRSGRTWRRSPGEGIVQVINVQWSPRRDDEAWFTLNAGVYFRAMAESIALFPVTDTPREYRLPRTQAPAGSGRRWVDSAGAGQHEARSRSRKWSLREVLHVARAPR